MQKRTDRERMLVPKTDRFPEMVDESQALLDAERWVLMVFAVPDRLGGLMNRYGFLPSKKNPTTFWRAFLSTDRAVAEIIVKALRTAGLKGRWVKSLPKPRAYQSRHKLTDFSKPHVSEGWRRKRARRT